HRRAVAHPAAPGPRYTLATLELENAYSLFLTGAPLDEVIRHLQEARSLAESLVATDRTVIEHRVLLAEAHAMLGEYLSRAGRKEAAWDARQAARALQEELVAASPTVGLKAGLSDNYNKLGRLALDAGRTDEARDYVRRALEISERLAREHPSIDSYQSHLAYVFRSMCMVEEKA